MEPFEQGALDSLCGIYSIVNAEKQINGTSSKGSRELFNNIIKILSDEKSLGSILTEGMLSEDIKKILFNPKVKIAYKKRKFAGVKTPDLDDFWKEMISFLEEPNRAIILGISGKHDHWTVIKKITDKQIQLFDSDRLSRLDRKNCTTASEYGKRHHVLWPAQTYFLSQEK